MLFQLLRRVDMVLLGQDPFIFDGAEIHFLGMRNIIFRIGPHIDEGKHGMRQRLPFLAHFFNGWRHTMRSPSLCLRHTTGTVCFG
ncbi:hypothetical protein D1872_279270 [compost metagenome]